METVLDIDIGISFNLQKMCKKIFDKISSGSLSGRYSLIVIVMSGTLIERQPS
jgi:hypothetical protein